ncbi:hypothetical protein LB521_27925 [Mesorhizobium sp. BR-1-1-8]|uniref:hypothetical protein n=1 Tax=unclassified Mesorhizobium TaxID=325217 RepID=UPI001CCDF130|nr:MULTISPECIES: hypothetical protein [unclassified Mesorhizobium]MBZ9973477.1 hypothetical protein [Mesorhizobium sp. BR1-1-12]MBZ9984967.1 hypothetical protein [Mesorhizobium sp. BR-1-1-8]
MGAIDFDYSVDLDATDKQGGGFGALPVMHARIWAEAIDFPKTKDEKGRQAAVIFEVQEPESYKGRKFREWWTMIHPDGNADKAYARGKNRFDKFCRAVQVLVEKGTDSDELLFKSFVVKIGVNEFNGKTNNQIEHFYYEDDDAKEPIPELGIIGDGSVPASAPKAASNDNKPAAQPQAAPAKKLPWGAKKAA